MQEKANCSIPDALAEYLEDSLKVLRADNAKIKALEFGTGAGKATEILARFCDEVHTFDAKAEWSEHAKNKLKGYNNINYYVGYDPKPLPANKKFNFVLIDGPKGGKGELRKHALIRFWDRVEDGALIIMDDCHRTNEQKYLQDWKNLWGTNFVIHNIGRGVGIFHKPKLPKTPVYLMTYERPEYFKRSITSLLKTDLSKGQLHVWDDGSTSTEKEQLLANYLNEVATVTVFDPNQGTPHMFLHMARHFLYNYDTEYAVLVQDDIEYRHEWLNKLLEIAKTVPDLGILSPWDRKAVSNITKQGYIIRNPVNSCQIGGVCWLVSRKFMEGVLRWAEEHTPTKKNAYDSMFQTLCYDIGLNVATTSPSYVQHFGIDSIAHSGRKRESSGYRASNYVPDEKDG